MRATELDSPPVTFTEYERWPETNLPCEFVDGHPVVSPAPSLGHQHAIGRLQVLLDAAAPDHLAVLTAPLDWVLRRRPLLVRQPDMAVVETALLAEVRLVAPPLLAVEILSPTSRERDLVTKRAEYAAAGLDWYWLVDLEIPQIVVLRRGTAGYTIHASARGDEQLSVDAPFPLRLSPAVLQPRS